VTSVASLQVIGRADAVAHLLGNVEP